MIAHSEPGSAFVIGMNSKALPPPDELMRMEEQRCGMLLIRIVAFNSSLLWIFLSWAHLMNRFQSRFDQRLTGSTKIRLLRSIAAKPRSAIDVTVLAQVSGL